MRVCSTNTLYHYFFSHDEAAIQSILETGLRPLSDFPESERWQQIEAQMPGFYRNLYEQMCQPILKKPYDNSGIFITPIDFRLLPESLLADKPRIRIPISAIQADWTCISFILEEQRISVPFTTGQLSQTAEIWTAEMVTEWFALDPSRLFFHVPQVAVYQPGGIAVRADWVELPIF